MNSSLEAFLDHYQSVRLVVGVVGTVTVSTFVIGGWWTWGTPVPGLVASMGMAAHAAWCQIRQIRAPRQMMLVDILLVEWAMMAIPDLPLIMAGFYGFLALVTVLFTDGWWRWGLLTCLTALHVTAFLTGSGLNNSAIASLFGNLIPVAGVIALTTMLRSWMGRLDANRSQMLGTVSHELRNSLTGVLGLTEVVSTMETLEPVEARELIEMANQQASDATEIVEDLLTVSRLERSALTTQASDFDVDAEVSATVRRFQGAGTDVVVTPSDGSSTAWGDPLRVRQILRNLISNAIRYGGSDINIATLEVNGMREIVVRDNGEGVPIEDESTIFLPYRRSTRGRRDASSVGLGLWICHQLARTMGGDLVYRRRDGHTEFALTIPLAQDTQPPTTDPAAETARLARSERFPVSTSLQDTFAVA